MLSHSEVETFFDGTTFGMEYDCGSFDRNIELPTGSTYCTDEVACVNNSGIGNDPTGIYNRFGGEVQVRPCNSETELYAEINSILSACLADDPLFPGTIHVHVRIPQLLERVDLIKKIVYYSTAWWPHMIPHIFQTKGVGEAKGKYNKWLYPAEERVKRTVYDAAALTRMAPATTAREIAVLLHDHPDDWKNDIVREQKVMRPGINFGHLALNETIEFRCFITTTDPVTLWNIIRFPMQFIEAALTDDPYPVRLVRGVTFMDQPFEPPHFEDRPSTTSGYFANVQEGILIELVSGNITVADLNYPKFWIDRGFE